MMHRRNPCEQTQRPHQIALVIDHNEELLTCTTSVLSRAVSVVASEEAHGLFGGCNTGVAATEDRIAFIDDDWVIDEGWLDSRVARRTDPDIPGAGGWMNPQRVGLRPAWLPEEFTHATNSGVARAEFQRHWTIEGATPRVGMAE